MGEAEQSSLEQAKSLFNVNLFGVMRTTKDHEVRDAGVKVVLVKPAYTRNSFESNLIQADQQVDEYMSAPSNVEAVMRDVMKNADSPEAVAVAVLKASTAGNPRRRYAAGGFARQVSLLRRFVPASGFDKSLRKQLRFPAWVRSAR